MKKGVVNIPKRNKKEVIGAGGVKAYYFLSLISVKIGKNFRVLVND